MVVSSSLTAGRVGLSVYDFQLFTFDSGPSHASTFSACFLRHSSLAGKPVHQARASWGSLASVILG
eukprot:12453296-Prorocentrum_lima.AAC.1